MLSVVNLKCEGQMFFENKYFCFLSESAIMMEDGCQSVLVKHRVRVKLEAGGKHLTW